MSIHALSVKTILPCIFGDAEESDEAAWYGKSVFNCKKIALNCRHFIPFDVKRIGSGFD